MFKKAFREFANSKNKIYVILKYNASISAFFAILTIVFGTIGFYKSTQPFSTALLNSIKIFGLDYPSEPNETNVWIFLAIIFAILTISLLAVVFLIKESLNAFLIERTFNKDHIAVFGLGEASVSFIDSYSLVKGKEDIAIIESDPNNQKLEEYRKKGIGIFIGDSLSDKALKLLNFQKMKYAVIAMGSDKINIELAHKIIRIYNEKKINTEIKIIVHILNRDLDMLFHQNLINNKTGRIGIKTFSFYNEAAEEFFDNHPVDGESDKYVTTDNDMNTIVAGDGNLLKSVVYQMALISHLPNANKHIVHIVDKDANNLVVELKKFLYYRNEEINFPTFKIKAVEIDSNTLEYFDNPVWKLPDLVNVIVAYDSQEKNLDLAIELFNRTYLSKAVKEDNLMPKIIFAIYDKLLLTKAINQNKESFKHFYTFANSEDVLSYQNLIEENKYFIAKLIHSNYKAGSSNNSEENKKSESIAGAWYNSARYSDKLSSIAQAKHIGVKLKAMGLKQVSPTIKDKEKLLEHNKQMVEKVFNEPLPGLDTKGQSIIDYFIGYSSDNPDDIPYFPENYSLFFDKMIRMEHNRWNAYHFLNGWQYSKVKAKEIKQHDCLIPLEEFEEIKMKQSVLYDIHSFLYIPYYLTEAGYQLAELN